MEFLADPIQSAAAMEHRRFRAPRVVDSNPTPASEQQTERRHSLCKQRCCRCITTTSLKCMGICFTGTMLLIVGVVMLALYFTASQNKNYLIPALVLFILGIIFISIAEWFCRVKIYHRYGQNHQQTLERLSGIERRLNTGGNTLDSPNDEPPPYNTNTAFVTHELPSVNTYASASRAANVTDVQMVAPDMGSEEVPSYSITVSDDVLPTYVEATSSDFGVAKKQVDATIV